MKIIRNLLLVLTLLFVTSCKEDTFMKDYPQLEDKKHIYEVVEIDRVLDIFENDETAVILMGFSACPWCQAIVPYVNEVSKAEGLKQVYYLVKEDNYINAYEITKDIIVRNKELYVRIS